MFDAEIATMEECRVKFEKEFEARAPATRASGKGYIDALTAFVERFNKGPGADSRRMGSDTTGTLDRVEDHVVWAEGERHRVRKALNDIV
jgi:hypothetical protein